MLNFRIYFTFQKFSILPNISDFYLLFFFIIVISNIMYKLLVILFIIKLYARNSVKLLLRLPLMTNLNREILEILKCLEKQF